ncbi:NAC transcription factor ONAC010-like [Panicum virgatum]|nr:NAC transcription factor ONAC010-like [Panicum virgatum]
MLRPTKFHAPPAFDSHPSDVVLVKSYLRPWVAQGVRPAGAFVHAADLYAAEPGELARRFRAAVARDGERAWYFLSPLRTKSPRGRRKARTVAGGAGWWHGEAGPRPVLDPLDGRRMVGYRQSFSFMRRGADGAPVRTGWIMLELRLHDDDGGDGAGGIGDQLEGLVLCKVYRSPRHPGHADGDDLDESCAAAPAGRHSNVAEDDGSSDSPAAPPGGKRKAGDDGEPSAATPRRHIRTADDETSGAAAPTVLGPKEKTADDGNETSGATTAAARGDEGGKKAADDEDSSASTPPRKRAKTADDEGAKRMAGAPATQQLHCPQCGFHLGSLQAVVSPAKSTSETKTGIGQADETQGGGRTGDLPAKDLLRFRDPKQA